MSAISSMARSGRKKNAEVRFAKYGNRSGYVRPRSLSAARGRQRRLLCDCFGTICRPRLVSFGLGSRCRSARGRECKLLIQLTSKRLKGLMIGSRFTQCAQLRFSVIGQLLAAPPAKSALRSELVKLAAREWHHPATGEPVRFGASTIERWYYRALRERHDPVAVLGRKRRQDAGQQASRWRWPHRCARRCSPSPPRTRAGASCIYLFRPDIVFLSLRPSAAAALTS